jgi:hypothetical protein
MQGRAGDCSAQAAAAKKRRLAAFSEPSPFGGQTTARSRKTYFPNRRKYFFYVSWGSEVLSFEQSRFG